MHTIFHRDHDLQAKTFSLVRLAKGLGRADQ